jgi:peptidyl-prolyl cis-trans isomerase-like 3
MKGFMIQTGDPSNTGKQGKSIWGSNFKDEFSTGLLHSSRGMVAMANKGPDSNGSQFYITYAKQPHLDGKNTVFARVIDGLETLDSLEKLEVDQKSRPNDKIYIREITIHANPLA